jgi:DNA-binding CsgD family transcriptional regulator
MSKRWSDDGETLPLPAGAEVAYLTEELALLSFPLADAEVPEALSPAEQEVALKVYAGATNKQIADARGVSPRTIGNQLESIYRKLGVSSRAELVLRLRGNARTPRR